MGHNVLLVVTAPSADIPGKGMQKWGMEEVEVAGGMLWCFFPLNTATLLSYFATQKR
jgi:hypothetical protein